MEEKCLVKHTEEVGRLRFDYAIEWTGLFGERFFIRITKTCKNIPGFAPATYEEDCGKLVMCFKGEEPYWSTPYDSLPILSIDDIRAIYDVISRGFEPDKHPTVERLREHLGE